MTNKYDATDEMVRRQALHSLFEELEHGKENNRLSDDLDFLRKYFTGKRDAGHLLSDV